MIRMATPAIADSLTYIFNQAITLASFPDEWKIARVYLSLKVDIEICLEIIGQFQFFQP